ncbi:Uncharacterised protein [Burkholderia oklahomensis]|nr:hypothetical protein BG90_2185 [Burkholderia oklahomensis C6786]SUW57731.1 Uncharacterised protein [Burkholderia oklahomensis]
MSRPRQPMRPRLSQHSARPENPSAFAGSTDSPGVYASIGNPGSASATDARRAARMLDTDDTIARPAVTHPRRRPPTARPTPPPARRVEPATDRLTLFIDSTEEPTAPPTVALRFSRRLTILRTFRRAGGHARRAAPPRRRPGPCRSVIAPRTAAPRIRRTPERLHDRPNRRARATLRRAAGLRSIPTEPSPSGRPISRLCSNP